MAKKKNNWVGREVIYLLLAPLLVMTGVLLSGILFDTWYKDPVLLLKASGFAYAGLFFLRLFSWIYKAFDS